MPLAARGLASRNSEDLNFFTRVSLAATFASHRSNLSRLPPQIHQNYQNHDFRFRSPIILVRLQVIKYLSFHRLTANVSRKYNNSRVCCGR
jgi:hypothetical protein